MILDHHKICELASRYRPAILEPTVSAFTSWIFDLSHEYIPSSKRDMFLYERRQGEEFEKGLLQIARERAADISDQFATLEYRDPLDGTGDAFAMSRLKIGNSPLRGGPDIVYKHIESRKIIIVENKCSTAIPRKWPNLKIQLWCYGQIDRWLDAPDVILIGRVYNPRHREAGGNPKDIATWYRKDKNFDSECWELFEIFRSWLLKQVKRPT
ncbi:hypothetical protein ACI7BZ_07660 [Xanthobacter sp. AM11]|uniref:hypothetical protein n=1 Tax=Xanthobacter sp. AM11 TaxID=3380643 RepID=UPI0039BF9C4E